jgi:hypothetical protein
MPLTDGDWYVTLRLIDASWPVSVHGVCEVCNRQSVRGGRRAWLTNASIEAVSDLAPATTFMASTPSAAWRVLLFDFKRHFDRELFVLYPLACSCLRTRANRQYRAC